MHNGKVSLMVETVPGGFHWVYTNDYGDSLSVILRKGSYGSKQGLFEIMPSWESFGDNGVKGFCSFGEVQAYINTLKIMTDDKAKAENSTVKTIV